MMDKFKKYINDYKFIFTGIFGYGEFATFCEILAIILDEIGEKKSSRDINSIRWEVLQKNPTRKIADYYGFEHQKLKCIEEMAELMQVLLKMKSQKDISDNLIEEMADVKIMLEQMIYLLNLHHATNKMKQNKVKRTLDRMYKEAYQIDESEAK